MTTPVIIGDATLYLGDCREILPTLGKVDAVVTDPPYGINHVTSHGASWAGTRIAGDNDTTLRDEILGGFENVASFGTWKTPPIRGAKGCLVFDKGPAFGMGDLSFPWKGSWELIYIRGKIWRGRRDEGVLRGHVQWSWETRAASMHHEARCHPHQKPVSLLCELINKLPTSCVVLDPFMGSGTTGIACTKLGRAFVGIEIEAKHFENARRRISEAHRQPEGGEVRNSQEQWRNAREAAHRARRDRERKARMRREAAE